MAPVKLTDFKFSELEDTMKKYQDPTPSIIVQRYKFNSGVDTWVNQFLVMWQSYVTLLNIASLVTP